ncbi:hypothetical protein BJX61DRAFT_535566 [Aspergillus egyptiacus]|nr:hypothetical protein BJX61DRAFT_535566 [Aspergillus egyptiacus]
MRTILRIGAAGVLVLVLLWVDARLAWLNKGQSRVEIERDSVYTRLGERFLDFTFDETLSPVLKRPRRPAITDLIPDQYRVRFPASVEGKDSASPTALKNDGVIVVGKLESEDTNWVIDELPDWDHAIYTVDNPTTLFSLSQNKGRESNVYLHYIINHYYTLPSTIVFLHSHRDGYPRAWRTEFDDHSNVRSIRNLQTDFVQRNGYANLRCNPIPGCPDEIRPLREPKDAFRPAEVAFAETWRLFFNDTNVPEVIGVPCCSQFAVSREQVHQRPLSSYVRYHQWLMETDLPDDVSGRVMEYMWHIIFGQSPVYCPEMEECFSDVYGLAI